MPVRITDEDMDNNWITPMTITDAFQRTVKLRGDNVALRVMRDKEYTWTWNQYFLAARQFAKSLHHIGVQARKSVNIMGSNAPEWAISFIGSLFYNNLPSGVC